MSDQTEKSKVVALDQFALLGFDQVGQVAFASLSDADANLDMPGLAKVGYSKGAVTDSESGCPQPEKELLSLDH